VSQIDDRTTFICQDAHGQTVELDEFFSTIVGPLSGPPAHYSCRSMVDLRTREPKELSRRDPRHSGARYVKEEKSLAKRELQRRKREFGSEVVRGLIAREAEVPVPARVLALRRGTAVSSVIANLLDL